MASTNTADPRRSNPRRLARRPRAAARKDGAPQGQAPASRGTPAAKRPPSQKTPAPPARGKRPPEQQKQPPRGKAPVARPANENEPSNAALIGRLKRKPSSVPYWIAAIGCLIWIFVAAFIVGQGGFNLGNGGAGIGGKGVFIRLVLNNAV